MRRTHPSTWLLLGVMAVGLPACRQLGGVRGTAAPTPLLAPAPQYSPAPAPEGPLPPPPMAGFSKPKAAQTTASPAVAGTEPRRGWWSRFWPGGAGEKPADGAEMSPVSSEADVELNEETLTLPELPRETTRVELPQWEQLSATEIVETPVPEPSDAEDFLPLADVAVEIDYSTFLAELNFSESSPQTNLVPPPPSLEAPRLPIQPHWQLVGGPEPYPKSGADHGIRIEPGPVGAPLPLEAGRPKPLPWQAAPVWAGRNPGWDGREIR